MDFPAFFNKWIISNKFIKNSPFWWWYRLISHQDFRLDDFTLKREFFSSINQGWELMEYKWVFEEFWGKGSYPPPITILSKEDFDTIAKDPPSEETMESIKILMKRPSPWSHLGVSSERIL